MGIKLVKSILIILILLAFPALAHEMVVEAAIDRKIEIVADSVTVTSHQFAPMDKECAAHFQAATDADAPNRAPQEIVECLQKLIRQAPRPLVFPQPMGEVVPIELRVDLDNDVSIGITP